MRRPLRWKLQHQKGLCELLRRVSSPPSYFMLLPDKLDRPLRPTAVTPGIVQSSKDCRSESDGGTFGEGREHVTLRRAQELISSHQLGDQQVDGDRANTREPGLMGLISWMSCGLDTLPRRSSQFQHRSIRCITRADTWHVPKSLRDLGQSERRNDTDPSWTLLQALDSLHRA
eukprot:5495979-Amphidinium_carterae.1